MNWKHLDKESNFFSSHSSEAVGDHGNRTINSEGPSVPRALQERVFFKSTNKKGKKCCTTDVQSWLIYDKKLTTENQCFDVFQIPIIKSQHKSFYKNIEDKVRRSLVERCSVIQPWQTQLIVQHALITYLPGFLKGEKQCFKLES